MAQYDRNNDKTIGKDEYPDESLVKLWFLYDLDGNGTLDKTDWRYLLARGTAKQWLVRDPAGRTRRRHFDACIVAL